MSAETVKMTVSAGSMSLSSVTLKSTLVPVVVMVCLLSASVEVTSTSAVELEVIHSSMPAVGGLVMSSKVLLTRPSLKAEEAAVRKPMTLSLGAMVTVWMPRPPPAIAQPPGRVSVSGVPGSSAERAMVNSSAPSAA